MRVSDGWAALYAMAVFAVPAGASAQDSSPPGNKLGAWVGHWKVRIETKETQFGHASTEDYDAQCSSLLHGAFVACEYLGLQPDPDSGRIIKDVALLYYSDLDKTFKYTNVAPEGGPREDVMVVEGNVWTRPFEIKRRSGGVANAREIYQFVSPDKQLARLEISTDKGAHWTLVNEAVGAKQR
ncbi:MAG TPA: hypothetical protein VNX02_18420 [Steroidobacteraceae bacterium]|jgi:hypothetical protein|nr:hypothetical protein [Steroidobacteraceae bacterium]